MSETGFYFGVGIYLITFIAWMTFCFWYVFKDFNFLHQNKNSDNENPSILIDKIEGYVKDLPNSKTFYNKPHLKGDIANVISGPVCLCNSSNRNLHWVTEELAKCQRCGGFYPKPEK